ncbi:hypothetical protein EV384_1719 [Micromonospora kangleipakensis]|uniref:Uncharacterized protein n=1 Tax=Micromonospora kangleipakensis TaxID=1077942 RepID=A0A4Q8B6S0_9ACTN|nr:hypothetical protein [Micromonospora kangleipakensis]RZU73317.1 hypothetical protein EV384_1719 [Micromonospora kangleipakensis]
MSEQVAPPPAPYNGQPEPAVQASPPAETGKSRRRKVLGILGLILAVLVVGGLKGAWKVYQNRDETAQAKVGDCIAQLPEIKGDGQEHADDAKVVECTSTDAAFTVVGRVDDQNEEQAKSGDACGQYFKEGEDGYVFSGAQRSGEKYYLLCLTKKA